AKNGDRFAAARFDLAHDTLGFNLVGANIDDHRSAGPRERKRDCTTDITPGTGNDRDLAGELLVFSHDPRLSPQECQIDFAFVKFRQLLERGNGALVIPTAVTDVEYKLFPDVGARQGLVCTAPEMWLPLLDHAAIIKQGADVACEVVGIRIIGIDNVPYFRRESEHIFVAHRLLGKGVEPNAATNEAGGKKKRRRKLGCISIGRALLVGKRLP